MQKCWDDKKNSTGGYKAEKRENSKELSIF